jgi:hypothetical protein
MPPVFRDDCPPEYALGRRLVLAGGVISIGAFAASLHAGDARSGEPPSLAPAKFMEISTLLIDHKLNAEVGARLASAMGKMHSGIERDIDQILDVARRSNARIVEDFFPNLPEGRLRETCLAIISAWYTGVVVDEMGSEVFAYEYALMYQPTHDVMTIPSYAISRPNGWNAQAPPLTDMPVF